MYKVLGAESCSGGDSSQQKQEWSANQNLQSKNTIKKLPSVVKEEVEQQFSWKSVTL
jgi:hypothetical protein